MRQPLFKAVVARHGDDGRSSRSCASASDSLVTRRRDVEVGLGPPTAGVLAAPPSSEDPEMEKSVSARDGQVLTEVVAIEAKGVKPVRMRYSDSGQKLAFARQSSEVPQPEILEVEPTELTPGDTQVNANPLRELRRTPDGWRDSP